MSRVQQDNLSIRQRLLIMLLGMIVVVWGGVTISAYHTIQREMARLLDTQIAQIAYSLLEINLDKVRGYKADIPEDVSRYLDRKTDNMDIRYQVWRGDSLQLHSLNAPKKRLNVGKGYSNIDYAGAQWRVFRLQASERIDEGVVVMARHRVTRMLAHPVTEMIVGYMIIQLILVGLIIWFAVNKGLAPLHKLAGEIRSRHDSDLSPVDTTHMPHDLRPVTDALNQLFERLQISFEREREFTNHAAHELRTPLASLKMQIQVAMRENDAARREDKLATVQRGVDRAEHVVNQLLAMARLEPDSQRMAMERIDFAAVVESVMEDHVPLAEARSVQVQYEAGESVYVTGNTQSLRILIGNLLDNAVRYTPEGGNVALTTQRDATGAAIFRIADNGPGIPVDQRQRIFERFTRLPGSKGGGVGMGLSIALKIADLHQATLEVADPPEEQSGTVIIVRFPA